jgi:hypothetical protein
MKGKTEALRHRIPMKWRFPGLRARGRRRGNYGDTSGFYRREYQGSQAGRPSDLAGE